MTLHPREPAIDILANMMGGCTLFAMIVIALIIIIVVVNTFVSIYQ